MKTISAITALILFGLALTMAGACSGEATVTSTAGGPVEVVSVSGPYPPYNAGGPAIQIVLKNVSVYPITALMATITAAIYLTETGVPPPTGPNTYKFVFDVSAASPLAPGDSTSLTKTLFNASISEDDTYPLMLEITFQAAQGEPATTSYTQQVHVSTPLS